MGDYVSFDNKKWKVISEPVKNSDGVYEYEIKTADDNEGVVTEDQISKWTGGKRRHRRTNKKSSRRRRRTRRR
jgi:hypothetical protein